VRTYIDYLARVVQSLSDATHTSSAALAEICDLAYATPEDIPETALTEQTRAVCRKRLEAVFAKLITRTEDFGTLSKVVSAIDPKSMNMGKDLKARLKATLKRTKTLAKEQQQQKSEASGAAAVMPALSLLYAVAILQLYNQDPDALNVIGDLDTFHDQLAEKGDIAAEVSFLVETLLSLVVRPSSLMRQVSQKVFEVFSGHLNAEALRLLTGPLERDENSKGQAELFDTADDGDEDEDMDEDPDEADVDDEDGEEEEDDEDGDEEEDDGDDEDEADSDEEDGGEDQADGLTIKGGLNIEDPEGLDNALENLLQTRRLDRAAAATAAAQGTNGVAADGDDSDDSDMTDSEMLALDDKISAAFKLRAKASGGTSAKQKQRDARETVVNFKHRILDLLDVYVRARPADPLVFAEVVLPVLRLVRATSTRALANRAAEILQTLFKGVRKARQASSSEEVSSDANDGKTLAALATPALLPLLREIHAEAPRDASHAFARAASCASLLVVSAMHALDERGSVAAAAEVYADTQVKWVLGEWKLQPAFFTEWLNWCQSIANQPRA
jgi:DNA polymerase phi